MNKRILVPTDFSKNSLNAIHYALELYKSVDSDFYFMNVYQVDGYTIDNMMMFPEPGEPNYEAAKSKSKEGLEALLEHLKFHADNSKHTYHTISTFNSLLEAVKMTISQKDIDLVIMGTKGNTGSNSVLYGTNTINVMEELTGCSVLSIPEKVQFTPPKEIVFPTDFNTAFKHKELDCLIEIAKIHNCFVRVLHIDSKSNHTDGLDRKQQENKELLHTILGQTEHSFHSLRNVKVQDGINAFVESRDSDMIAFINPKHHFFRNLFKKPLVKELGFHSYIPILEMNDRST